MSINGPQLHLALNHFPVVGFVFLTIGLILVMWKGDERLKRIILATAVFISLTAVPAYFTGEPAEEGVEHLAGVSESLIHEHEEAAERAIIVALLTGVIALGGLLASRKSGNALAVALRVVLVGSAMSTVAMIRVGHLGGKIRHPEISAESQSGIGGSDSKEESEKHDDRD